MLARRAAQQQRTHSQAPPLSPASSSPSSPMSPTSPEFHPSPGAQSMPHLAIPGFSLGSSNSSPYNSPPADGRPHTFMTTPSIQKYSDALRRALSARFESVAAAGRNARPPPPAARYEDPDYGYDEDPFDTRAKLLLSLGNRQPEADSPPPEPGHQSKSHAPDESFFDLGSDTEYETESIPRRWSVASSSPSVWVEGTSTPSSLVSRFSEASFEVGRASDWVNVYGRSRLSTPQSRRNSFSNIHAFGNAQLTPAGLRPLTPLTPSPQPVRRLRRRAHPYDFDGASTPPSPYEPPMIARTTSETMILAAGLASQRERRRPVRRVKA